MGILEQCDEWAKVTYGDHIKNKYGINGYNIYGDELDALSLLDKKMLGSSIEELPKISEKNSYKISFADTFCKVIDSNGTLCDYVIKIIDQAIDRNLSFNTRKGLVARSLRSFASFLRERHFKEILSEILNKRDIEYNIDTSIKLDMKYHTDLLLEYNNEKFAIWIYQASKRGISNTSEKILGERKGKIIEGLNVLCPINPFSEHGDVFVKNEWSFYSENYIWYILGMIESDSAWEYTEVCDKLKEEKEKQIDYKKSFIYHPRIFQK